MSETFDKVVWIIALLILIPVVLSPSGWIFALIVAVVWVSVAYGGRYVLGVEKVRRSGERAKIQEIRSRDRGK